MNRREILRSMAALVGVPALPQAVEAKKPQTMKIGEGTITFIDCVFLSDGGVCHDFGNNDRHPPRDSRFKVLSDRFLIAINQRINTTLGTLIDCRLR